MPSPVSDIYAFGLLVKSWATGLDYLTTSGPPDPSDPPAQAIADNAAWALPRMSSLFVPIAGSSTPASVNAVAMTWDTFEGILHNANNVISVGAISNPTGATNVLIVQGDNNTMVLRLPPKLRVQQSEKAFLAGDGAYQIPSFYNELYKDKGPPTIPKPKDSKDVPARAAILKLQANRIGDYTMSLCDHG
jgi:hypothetical protein